MNLYIKKKTILANTVDSFLFMYLFSRIGKTLHLVDVYFHGFANDCIQSDRNICNLLTILIHGSPKLMITTKIVIQ